ncbi:MAG: ATP-binding protein, partial [Burkholderiaceae bacterium]
EHHEREPGLDAPSLHRYARRVAFQVFHEGRLAMRSANAPRQAMVEPGAALRPGFLTVQIDGTAWRMFAAQGAQRDVQVLVGEQLESRADILWAVLRSMLWPQALALPLLGLAAWWAVRQGVRPLQRLRGTLAARAPSATGTIEMHDVPSEMAPMLDALNQLFLRIATMLDLERRFTADAAHELRTPIAAIRAQAQVALGVANEAARRTALERTLQGCDRASHLVDQLLMVSRLDAQASHDFEALDLSELVRGVAAELAPQAIRNQQTLELDAPQPCRVRGNPTLLAVLARNLIDNAVRYSPAGATVAVRVQAQAERVSFCVHDSGPGLTEPQRQRLGERFFRVAGSGQGGSGLGWSIVRRIAQVHAAQLHVESAAALGGLAVCCDFQRVA